MRSIIPGCDIEGEMLENARIKKKQTDKRFTQDYTAALAGGRSQNVWSQWKAGTLRIADRWWVKLALELDFDPFETRPELRELARLIHKADAIFSQQTAEVQFENLRDELDPNQAALIESLINSLRANK